MEVNQVITRRFEGWTHFHHKSLIDRLHLISILWVLTVFGTPQLTGAFTSKSAPTPLSALAQDSEPFRDAQKSLPPRFQILETRRFIIFSDTDSGWTRTQADRLERTHHQFLRFTRRLGLDPEPLRHKLVCVLFDRRDDYQAFARQHDDVADPWIAGYYSPQHDRIVFYNVKSNPSVTRARIKLGEMRDRVAAVSRDAKAAARRGDREIAQSLLELNDQYREHIDHELERVEEFSERVSVATTIHEAVHMLCFHTRVQSPRVQYPLWICEGLATAFETTQPRQAFGPDFEYPIRRERFTELLDQNNLLDLKRLVTITGVTLDEDKTDRVYHQSYALLTWMQRFRKKELAQYFRLMQDEPPGAPTAERHLELFEQAFGDVNRLQRVWLRHERSQ